MALSLSELQAKIIREMKASEVLENVEISEEVTGGVNVDEMIENIAGGSFSGGSFTFSGKNEKGFSGGDDISPDTILEQVLGESKVNDVSIDEDTHKSPQSEEESTYEDSEVSNSDSILSEEEEDINDKSTSETSSQEFSGGSIFRGGITKFVPRVRILNAFPYLIKNNSKY
jgi:hypothetical protein